MENGMKPSYEQGERGNFSMLLSISLGFSLFWMLFFMALLDNPILSTAAASSPIAIPLPIAMCFGFIAMDVVIFKWCDFFSRERGHKILCATVVAHTIFPGCIVLMQSLNSMSLPSFFTIAAWVIFGVGLGCMLALWSELLVSFIKGFTSKTLAFSVSIGALLYFVMSQLPIPIGICLFCLAPAASLALLRSLEKELPAIAFVSRRESASRHKLTKPIDVLNTIYGMVFGLAIFMLSKTEPSAALYGGIALAIAGGALLMLPSFGKNSDKMMHGKVQKILFPILIIGLLPIPFVDSMMQMICTLVILVGYICLTLVNLDSLYCLVKKYKVAPFYLIGRGHGPILAGVGIGYLVGYMAAITNIVGDTFLSIASLVLVITLSISITFIDFDKDHLADEHARNTEEDLAHYAKKGEGFWKARCSIVAQKYDLSAREIEVFTLLAKGRGTTYIQDKLYISPHTVKSHTYKIYKKLGINSREELLTLIEDTVPDNSDSE